MMKSLIYQIFTAILICVAVGSGVFAVMRVVAADSYPENSVEIAWEKIETGALLIDVRSPEEYARGHLPEAVNIPHDQILAMSGFIKDKSRDVILYCVSGRRAGKAQAELKSLGFNQVHNGTGYQMLLDGQPGNK
jgi:phage shock protein E